MTQEHQGWNCATEAVSPTNITLALIDTCQQCRPAECVVVSQSLLSHASFMQTWDCCIFHHSVHITYFPTQIGIFDGNFIIICASVRFHYLDHLVASRMAPSMCPEPCGTRWGSWFQAILYHLSATYLVFMWSAYLFQMPHTTAMPK